MLILARERNQSVVIQVPGAEPVEVQVTKIGRRRIRLGFTASKSIKIFRKELANDVNT